MSASQLGSSLAARIKPGRAAHARSLRCGCVTLIDGDDVDDDLMLMMLLMGVMTNAFDGRSTDELLKPTVITSAHDNDGDDDDDDDCC